MQDDPQCDGATHYKVHDLNDGGVVAQSETPIIHFVYSIFPFFPCPAPGRACSIGSSPSPSIGKHQNCGNHVSSLAPRFDPAASETSQTYATSEAFQPFTTLDLDPIQNKTC